MLHPRFRKKISRKRMRQRLLEHLGYRFVRGGVRTAAPKKIDSTTRKEFEAKTARELEAELKRVELNWMHNHRVTKYGYRLSHLSDPYRLYSENRKRAQAGKAPIQERTIRQQHANRAFEYRRDARHLKERIPSVLVKQSAIAREKLRLLVRGSHYLLSDFGYSPLKGMDPHAFVQRFANIAHVMSGLSKPHFMAENEALLGVTPFHRMDAEAPVSRMDGMRSQAEQLTNWEPYNCRVFMEPAAFDLTRHGYEFWGYIKPKSNAVIGIQVFDADPKKLLEVAKAMAKRRPKDPIPIIDLYGKVFYP